MGGEISAADKVGSDKQVKSCKNITLRDTSAKKLIKTSEIEPSGWQNQKIYTNIEERLAFDQAEISAIRFPIRAHAYAEGCPPEC